MFMLIAKRNDRVIEYVPGFTRRSDAELEARRLNALPELSAGRQRSAL